MIINQSSYLMNTKLLNISNYYFQYYIILYKSLNCSKYYLYYTFFAIHNNNNNSYLIKIGYNYYLILYKPIINVYIMYLLCNIILQ